MSPSSPTEALIPQLDALQRRLDEARAIAGKVELWSGSEALARADREARYRFVHDRTAADVAEAEAAGHHVGPLEKSAIGLFERLDLMTREAR